MSQHDQKSASDSDKTTRVLVISAKVESLRVARASLAKQGCAVMTASNFKEAEKLCDKFLPDIIVCDSQLDLASMSEFLECLARLTGKKASSQDCL